MFNYNHLYYFYITVKSDSVTSAAEHLRISQPSLSSQLKVLEDQIQVKLFKKIGRKNELTLEGSLIYGFCRQMFEISEDMHESITDRIPYATRKITIGISNEMPNSFAAHLVSHFSKKYNHNLRPKIMMTSGAHEKLVEKLKFHEIDIAVTQFSMTDPDLENIEMTEVPVHLVSSMNKSVSKKRRECSIKEALKIIALDSKNTIPEWLLPYQGQKLRAEINDFFEIHSIKGRIVFESDFTEALTHSVVEKIGIAFLPYIYIPQTDALHSFGPKKGYWKHRIWLASHNKSVSDQLIKSFTLAFKEVCANLSQ
jgi:LysR family transcriptional activator of nhaA